MKKMFLMSVIPLFCITLLLGCSSGSTSTQTPEVQDIKPGERSIITPPGKSSQQPGSSIEERNI